MGRKKIITLCIGLVALIFLFLIIGICVNVSVVETTMFILGLLLSIVTIICLIVCLIGRTTIKTTPSN